MSKAVGLEGKDIMFSSNATPASEFQFANSIGAIINLDDFTHIDFLEKTIGHIPETISCRYNPGGVFKISNSIMDNPGDAKYGFTTEQLFEGFKVLKEKGAKHFGIHAFLASNTFTNQAYLTAQTRSPMTFMPSGKGSGKCMKKCWFRQAWGMWQFTQNWAGL